MSNFKNYFSFSATERKGILMLSSLVLSLVAILIFDIHPDSEIKNQDFASFDAEIRSFYSAQDSVRKSKYNKREYKPYKKKYKNFKANKESIVLIEEGETPVQKFIIEINSASAQEFQKLKGIGAVLSDRIVKFRKSIGGFYSVRQLTDVYGVKQEVIEANKAHLSVNSSRVLKLSINQSEFKQLLKHPYLNYDAVKCIFGFRNKSDSVLVQQAITCVVDSLKPKLEPYLKQ